MQSNAGTNKPRRLVICCDGTWNDDEDRTHIYRLAQAAKELRDPSIRCFYDKGVGTRGLIERLSGGIGGSGISRNIREAYRWLMAMYRPGDEIYLFGFSRGAYTVRSLAGFLSFAGLFQPEDEGWVGWAYAGYRSKFADPAFYEKVRAARVVAEARRTPIRFIGVFDTVAAVGVPIGWIERLRNWWDPSTDGRFHDATLGRHVATARQALALDEMRGPYNPVLWSAPAGEADERRDIQQVWFAGVHSDVGGGYEDKRLGEVALDWMLAEAAKAGLDLRPGFADDPLYPSPFGLTHNSVSRFFRRAGMLSRSLRIAPRLLDRLESGHKAVGVWVHPSVRQRCDGKDRLPDHPPRGYAQRPYAPRSPIDALQQLVIEAMEAVSAEASSTVVSMQAAPRAGATDNADHGPDDRLRMPTPAAA